MRHINLKLNDEEERVHEWLKDFFGFRDLHGEDSQTLKMAQTVAFNVLRNTFGDNLKDIFKRETRDKLIEIRAVQNEKIRKSNTLKSKK